MGGIKGVKARPFWAKYFVNSFIAKREEYVQDYGLKNCSRYGEFSIKQFAQELRYFSFLQFKPIPMYVERCNEEQI